MSQHFLLSAKARSLSLPASCASPRKTAYETFKAIRWADTEGKPFCASAEASPCMSTRRGASSSARVGLSFSLRRARYSPSARCRCAICWPLSPSFVNGAKGHSALQLSPISTASTRPLSSWRTNCASDGAADKGAKVSGEVENRRHVHGRYVKPPTTVSIARPPARREPDRQAQVVIVAREREGKTLTF